MKSWHDECGVFGVWDHEEANRLTYLGLYALQHRGQESAGITTLDVETRVQCHHKGLGLVNDVFREQEIVQLKGRAAIGHVRYSTTGQNLIANAQPLTASVKGHSLSLAHNGNIVNAKDLRHLLTDHGAIFQGTNDTEVVLHLLARELGGSLVDNLMNCLKKLDGAFSLVLLSEDTLIAARDSYGFRPLVLGYKTNERGAKVPVVASETCALDLIGAEYAREIQPGEIYWVDKTGEHSVKFSDRVRLAKCIFEHVYFSRPDSVVFGQSVYESRKAMGARLAEESGVEADVVIPVPDSGVPAAIGYSQKSGVPFEQGIIRNHYVGRTFIEPKQSIRSFGVKVKLNPQAAVLKGKRVIVIDDSLVRGTTCQKIISLIRHAGAKEVHLRISAPPTIGACYYGVDTPNTEELIASHSSIEEIRKFVGADSLAYLSHDGVLKSVNGRKQEFCMACFDRDYPTDLYENTQKKDGTKTTSGLAKSLEFGQH